MALVIFAITTTSESGGTGALHGTVVDADGTLLPGIEISIAGAGVSASTLTDVEGAFRFSDLGPGDYRLAAYYEGFYRVEYPTVPVRGTATIDLRIMLTVVPKEVPCSHGPPGKGYFGPGVVCSGFEEKWYTRHLEAMAEPSLYQRALRGSSSESYRFLWLRSFHKPVAIRVEFEEPGTGRVVAKNLDGKGGYEPGTLERVWERQLAQQEIHEFRQLLERHDLWAIKTLSNRTGSDGAEWVIEAVRGGRYHAVNRCSPEEGAVREVGTWLLNLGEVEAEPIY